MFAKVLIMPLISFLIVVTAIHRYCWRQLYSKATDLFPQYEVTYEQLLMAAYLLHFGILVAVYFINSFIVSLIC